MSARASAVSQGRTPDAREGWGVTPDVILLGAAVVMTVAVVAFGIWLFVRASREDARRDRREGGA